MLPTEKMWQVLSDKGPCLYTLHVIAQLGRLLCHPTLCHAFVCYRLKRDVKQGHTLTSALFIQFPPLGELRSASLPVYQLETYRNPSPGATGFIPPYREGPLGVSWSASAHGSALLNKWKAEESRIGRSTINTVHATYKCITPATFRGLLTASILHALSTTSRSWAQ